jgi:hypothetical protein
MPVLHPLVLPVDKIDCLEVVQSLSFLLRFKSKKTPSIAANALHGSDSLCLCFFPCQGVCQDHPLLRAEEVLLNRFQKRKQELPQARVIQ